MDFATVRAMLDEIGVPQYWNYPENTILELMEASEKFESFGSPFRSCVLHDGKFRKTGQTDEFIEYKIVKASYIVQFGYGIDGIRHIYVYPHCDLAKLRSVLEPLVAQWKQEVASAEEFNAQQRARGPIRL